MIHSINPSIQPQMPAGLRPNRELRHACGISMHRMALRNQPVPFFFSELYEMESTGRSRVANCWSCAYRFSDQMRLAEGKMRWLLSRNCGCPRSLYAVDIASPAT